MPDKKDTRKILITAGPTVEPIDPVRYISNHSTGAFGYIIAEEARRQGFDVCIISGPVRLEPVNGVEIVKVVTAQEMKEEVIKRVNEYGCLIMAAAVCDFRVKKQERHKIKKKETLTLDLIKNPDILTEIKDNENLIKVGFALETDNSVENGTEKLKQKNLDFIIVNTIEENISPFGPDEAAAGKFQYIIIDSDNEVREFKEITKQKMAEIILNKVTAGGR